MRTIGQSFRDLKVQDAPIICNSHRDDSPKMSKVQRFYLKISFFQSFSLFQNRLATGNREPKASHIHCGFMYFRCVETEPCRLRVLFLELKADPCQSQRMHIEEARFVGEGWPQKTISVSMRCQRSFLWLSTTNYLIHAIWSTTISHYINHTTRHFHQHSQFQQKCGMGC